MRGHGAGVQGYQIMLTLRKTIMCSRRKTNLWMALPIGRLNNEVFLNVEERGHFVAGDQKMNDFFKQKN